MRSHLRLPHRQDIHLRMACSLSCRGVSCRAFGPVDLLSFALLGQWLPDQAAKLNFLLPSSPNRCTSSVASDLASCFAWLASCDRPCFNCALATALSRYSSAVLESSSFFTASNCCSMTVSLAKFMVLNWSMNRTRRLSVFWWTPVSQP